MGNESGTGTARVGHALALVLGSVGVFVFVNVSPAALRAVGRVFPEVAPLAQQPIAAELGFLAWFVFASYWFFALIDEKGWWKTAGLGLFLGYTWLLWGASMIAWPVLVVRHLRRSRAESVALPARRNLAVPAAFRWQAQECERMMRQAPGVRALIAGGRSSLTDVFRQTPVTLKAFVQYLEAALGWSPGQINRIFFRWYGIGHDYSYPMALSDLDPSKPDDVRDYLLTQGMAERDVRRILDLMPTGTEPPRPLIPERPVAPQSTGPEALAPETVVPTDAVPESSRMYVDIVSTPAIDPESWRHAR